MVIPRLPLMVGEDLFYGAYKTFKLSHRQIIPTDYFNR